MNEPDTFALVPKPPGAVGKAEAGAQRILSGMVADTLVLAKTAHAKQPHSARAPEQQPKTRPFRIVALDDESFLVECLKLMIENAFQDAEVLVFTDAEEAVEELAQNPPDLFTTDWNHPGKLHGAGLLDVLAGRKIKYPIIVISAYANTIQSKDALRSFLDKGLRISLLSKPFTLEELHSLLFKHLGSSHISITANKP